MVMSWLVFVYSIFSDVLNVLLLVSLRLVFLLCISVVMRFVMLLWILKFVCGMLCWNDWINFGSMLDVKVGRYVSCIVLFVFLLSVCVLCSMCFMLLSECCNSGSNLCLVCVSVMLWLLWLNRCVLMMFLSWWICMVSVGCDRCSCVVVCVKLLVCVMVMNV